MVIAETKRERMDKTREIKAYSKTKPGKDVKNNKKPL